MATGHPDWIDLANRIGALEAAQAATGWWSIAANKASVVGTVLTLAGVSIALFTYVGTAATARLSHMHMMFKSYLQMEFDYWSHASSGSGDELKEGRGRMTRDLLGSYKMYVLEEMYLWLRREKRMNVFYLLPWTHTRKHLWGWKKTLEWHLKRCSLEDRARFKEAVGCYGPSFQKEAFRAWDEEPEPRESLP